ncbi:MAG: NUDIX hydrolase [Candidatus Paceibacterota bacterium]
MNNVIEKPSHFSAGLFLHRRTDGSGLYDTIGVTKHRFPDGVQMPGGTNRRCLWEVPEMTLEREFAEETGYRPVSYNLLLSREFGDGGHTQNFFVIKQAVGHFNGPRTFTETDGEMVEVRIWELGEFHRHLCPTHRPAFLKACQVLIRVDVSFRRNYPEICDDVRAAEYRQEF